MGLKKKIEVDSLPLFFMTNDTEIGRDFDILCPDGTENL